MTIIIVLLFILVMTQGTPLFPGPSAVYYKGQDTSIWTLGKPLNMNKVPLLNIYHYMHLLILFFFTTH